MKRIVIILFCLLSVAAWAQLRRTAFFPVIPAAAGGGGGPSGAPGVLASATNSCAGATGITNSMTVSGSDTMLVFLVDWYPSTATATAKWNNSTVGVTSLTNGVWFNESPSGLMQVFYLVSPSAGSSQAAVTFSGSVDEATLTTIVLTNAAGTWETSSVLNAAGENSPGLTNSCPSADTDLMIGYCGIADSPLTVNLGAGQTLINNVYPGTSMHTGVTGTKAGAASSVTQSFWWTGNKYAGLIVMGAKGFP